MKNWLRWILVGIGAAFAINLSFMGTWGLEIISDNIPLFGNLDEAGAGALILYALTKK